MNRPMDEEERLRSTALQNVTSIVQERQRAADELFQTKEALEVRAKELARSVSALRATLESTTDAILVTGPAGELVDHNDKLMHIWGAGREKPSATDKVALWEPLARLTGDAPGFLRRLAEIEGSALDSFDQFELTDDRVIERSSTVQVVDGAIVGRVWSFRDVTERKFHESALRASHAQFSAIIHHSPVCMLLVDSALRLRQANPSAQPMLARIDQVIGRDVSDIMSQLWPASTASEIVGRIRRALDAGEPSRIRGFSAKRRDTGAEEHYDLEIHRLTLPDGTQGVVSYFVDVSSHERAQAALRDSEQRVRATFEQAAVGMALANLDGRFTQVNRRMEEFLGWSGTELCQRGFVDVTHEDDKALTRAHVEQLLRGEIPHFSLEKRYLRKDGTVVWSITTVSLIRSARGQPERFVAVVEDISERKRSEERERESAQRLQLALSAGQLGDWSWDTATDVVKFGQRAAECFGLPAGSSTTWAELRNLLHSDDRERAREAVEQALQTGCDYDIEYRVSPSAGEAKWIAAKGRGVYDRRGTAIGMIGVVQDVTERKRLELVKERLAAVVESSDDAIIAKDLNGIVQTWNTGAERIFGYGPDEMIGCSIKRLIPPELQPEEDAILARQRRGERVDHYETVRITKNGRLIDVSLTVSPIRDSTGKIVGASKVARDITERKVAEAELRRNEEERQELLDAERSARAEAERVSLMKDEFLATLSHELRTPLNAIVGWSQVLRMRGHDDPDLLEGLTVIDRNAKMQARLIEDLLDMSRIISGKVRLDVQRVDVQDVARAAVAAVRHSAEAKDIRLHVVLDPRAGPVSGDPSRLQQCFWNLLSNAIKFTPKGGRVQVTLASVNSHVEFSVIDTGSGIAPEFLPHVFERFRQADASTTRTFGGLGLGLSIVKSLVELHGGSVRAESAGIDKGSTFSIELPVISVTEPSTERSREHPRTGTSATSQLDHPSLRGVTVLVIDDEPDARNLLKRVLEDCGARVLVAHSAPAGMEVLQRERPDILISDIGMPGEDGYAFIRKVRQLDPEKGGRIPAAALSAFARPEDRTRALRAGYQMHLSKPVEPTELTAAIASLVSRK